MTLTNYERPEIIDLSEPTCTGAGCSNGSGDVGICSVGTAASGTYGCWNGQAPITCNRGSGLNGG